MKRKRTGEELWGLLGGGMGRGEAPKVYGSAESALLLGGERAGYSNVFFGEKDPDLDAGSQRVRYPRRKDRRGKRVFVDLTALSRP
jgi:hypothetical protein